ncbi:MAG: glycosyltransferase family 39 protein [Blastocatellia bacterium]
MAGSDVMQNIKFGRNFAAGNYYGVLDTYWPPLYPLLLGIVTYFINDLVLPAVIISIVTGSLAIPLTYYVVKQSYSHSPAVIAAVIAIFYPYLINSVFAIGTENIYFLCITGALIVGWNGLVKGSALEYILTGVLLGLAYLTRPEAIGYPFFFIALVIGKDLWQRQLFSRKTMSQVAAIILGFTLLAAPYISYLRSETGSWTISGKTSKNFASGIFSEETSQRGRDQEVEQPAGKPTVKNLASNFIFNLREAQKGLGQLMPMFLLLFAGLGLFGERWRKERLKREAYLLSFCLLTVFGYAATWVLERYLYVLFPIFFGWIALGVMRLEHWFRESSPDWTIGKFLSRINYVKFVAICLVFIYLYVFTINFYVRSRESAWQGAAYEERDAGIWLRENGKASPVIFSGSFRPVFYADGNQYWTETSDMRQVLEKIRNSRVDYVVDSERIHKKFPYLKGISEVLQNEPDFELIYERNDMPGYKISIFRLR